MRMTLQRKTILEMMHHLKSHPTADELYAMLKPKMPRISLATVYRNLEILAAEGLIRKLNLGGSNQKRFDGNPEPHWHIHCVQCGRIGDIEMTSGFNPMKHVYKDYGFDVDDFHIEFWGICPECKERKTLSNSRNKNKHV